MMAPGTTGPRFETILSARGDDDPPSDLDVLLRPHCRRIKTVPRLAGGAHVTVESLGVRAYFPYDVTDPAITGRAKEGGEKASSDDDFDDLEIFFRTFQNAAVLFVLPHPRLPLEQLGDAESLFHRAQRLARRAEAAAAVEGKVSWSLLRP